MDNINEVSGKTEGILPNKKYIIRVLFISLYITNSERGYLIFLSTRTYTFIKQQKNEKQKNMAKTKYIESPEKLWEYFCFYREEIKANPIKILEQRKSSVNFKIYSGADVDRIKEEMEEASKPIIEMPTERPLTIEGFENWCSDHNIIEDLGDYFSNKKNLYSEYSTICSRIKRVIRQDQIEGGMVGIYNPSITARLNNLKESTEIEQKTTHINYELSDLTEEERQTLFDLSMKVKHED